MSPAEREAVHMEEILELQHMMHELQAAAEQEVECENRIVLAPKRSVELGTFVVNNDPAHNVWLREKGCLCF